MFLMIFYFFFFKQKTAYEMRISDWSSDVCSSDLLLLPCALMIGGLLPGLVAAAPPTQSFYIYGQAQVLEGRLSLATPFVGEMRVDPAFTDPSFGQIGRVTSITLSFPLLWRVPAFNTIEIGRAHV